MFGFLQLACLMICMWGTEPTTRPNERNGSEKLGRSTTEKLPMALRAMEESRMRLRTGEVDWTRTSHTAKVPAARVRKYSYRWAKDQFICTFLGNESGVLRLDATGAPAEIPMRFPGPTSYLFQPGHTIWSHTKDDFEATQYTTEPPPLTGWDPRALGLTVVQPSDGQGLHEIIRKFGAEALSARIFSSKRVGSEYEVTAQSADGWCHVLTIDPNRGWNPTRITASFENGEIAIQSKISLRQYGSVWFPDRVEYFNSKDESAAPLWTIEVTRARINEPDLTDRLTPAEIGVEVGTVVRTRESWRSFECPPWASATAMAWDGKKLIDLRIMNEMIEKGVIQVGAHLESQLRIIRREPRPPITVNGSTMFAPGAEWAAGARLPLDVWERYVDSFAAANDFSVIQKNAAQGILKDLHQRAISRDASGVADLADELRDRLVHLLTPEQRDRLFSPKAVERPPEPGSATSRIADSK